MEKIQPTDTQIDVLMSDWLGNLRMKAEGNYTHKGKGGIKRKTHTDMRDYLIGNVKDMDDLDLIKNARMASENIVGAITPKPIKVKVGKDDSYHQTENGEETICLATDYFDDKTITKEEKVDIMLGLAAHEAAHSFYTESENAHKHIEKEHQELQQLKHNIFNIIEDERIEYLLGEDRPGVIECIGATKGYYFDKLLNRMKTEGKLPTEPLPRLLSVITQAIRYPSEMNREQVEENFEELEQVRRALTPYPLTPEGCLEATDRVMNIIRKKAEDELKKQQQQSSASSKQDNQNDNPGGVSSNSQNNKEKGNNQVSQPTEQQIRQAISNAMNTQQGKNVMDAIKKDINKSDAAQESTAIKNDNEAINFVNEDDSERMSSMTGGAGNPDTFIHKPKGNPEKYIRDLSIVRPYIPAMAKALNCKSQQNDYIMRSQPKGKLDTNKFVAYMAGSDKIFIRSGSVTCSSASVCMLIDESGSMGEKLKRAARQAAILVNEAIKRIRNVNFYCYGYTTAQINVYSENGKTSPWALSETNSISGTPTGEAMEMCARRVRRFTKDPVLMLVLTDGCPNDPARVIEQDEELRHKGFTPIGVGILTNAVDRIFKESITMNDISELAIEMGKLTKNRLNKMLVRTDSEN